MAPIGYIKIRFKSREMASTNKGRLDVRLFRDENIAHEYKRELTESLGELNDSNEPDKLWTDINPRIPKMSESCLRGTPGTSESFLTKETLNTIEEGRRARL